MSEEYVRKQLAKIQLEIKNNRATKAELAKINPAMQRTEVLSPVETAFLVSREKKLNQTASVEPDFLISRKNKIQQVINPDILQPEPDEEIEDINQYKETNYEKYDDLKADVLNDDGNVSIIKVGSVIREFRRRNIINADEFRSLFTIFRQASLAGNYDDLINKLVKIYNDNIDIGATEMQKDNDEKLARYKKRLENTYLGKFNTSQLPNESDEEFYYRIQSYKEQIPNADDAIQDEINENIKLFKSHLSKFLRPDEIELIINDKNIVNDTSLLFLNSTWKAFYNYIKQNYTSISVDSFTLLLRDYAQNRALPSFKLYKKQKQQETYKGTSKFIEGDSKLIYKDPVLIDIPPKFSDGFRRRKQDEDLLNSAGINDYIEADENPEPKFSEGFMRRKYKPHKRTGPLEPDVDLLENEAAEEPDADLFEADKDPEVILNNVDDILEELKDRPRADIMQKLPAAIQYFERIGVDADEIESLKNYLARKKPHITQTNKLLAPILKSARDKSSKGYIQQMIGLGIKKQNLKEEFVPFGKFVISLDKLHNKVLKVKYPNGYNHPKIRRQIKISSDFKNILMDILERQKFNERIFNLLDDSETEIILTLLKLAGLTKVLKIGHLENVSTKELMNEYDVICGEIHAGNDNPELIKRAKQLIAIMIKMGKISRQAGLEMILCL